MKTYFYCWFLGIWWKQIICNFILDNVEFWDSHRSKMSCRRECGEKQGRNEVDHCLYRSKKPYRLCCRTHVRFWPCRFHEIERIVSVWTNVPSVSVDRPMGRNRKSPGRSNTVNCSLRTSAIYLKYIVVRPSFPFDKKVLISVFKPPSWNISWRFSVATFLNSEIVRRFSGNRERLKFWWQKRHSTYWYYQLVFHSYPYPPSDNIQERTHLLYEIILRCCMY